MTVFNPCFEAHRSHFPDCTVLQVGEGEKKKKKKKTDKCCSAHSMCGATRENTSSRWTVHWTIGPFLNQMLRLVVKAGKSWKPVRRIFPGQMRENTDSSPPGSTFSYGKTRRSVPASRFIPNCYKYSFHSRPLGWCIPKQLRGDAFICF